MVVVQMRQQKTISETGGVWKVCAAHSLCLAYEYNCQDVLAWGANRQPGLQDALLAELEVGPGHKFTFCPRL